jgi:ABC-type polysaccharide/polyol phosphate transport system ATPase subunit
MPHIRLDHVSMFFRINQGSRLSLKDWVLQGFRPKHDNRIEVRALEDVSLEVQEGARLGVIGHNGAGKSTLLKLLAGIYAPTQGVCEVAGRVCSLFDIGLGFEPEATGWENIKYRGLAFQEKARRRISELIARARLMVFVSHDLPSLAQWCDRILWLDHGRVRSVGPVRETLSAYATFMHELANRAA